MKIAVFPLQVERFDDLQGVYGRQIARTIARSLEVAGVEVDAVNWYARRGEERAHVVLEAPLPRDVVREELKRRGARYGLVGKVGVFGEESTLELLLVEASPAGMLSPWSFSDRAPRESTPWLVDAAITSLLQFLQVPPPDHSDHPADIPFDAWTALLIDHDTQALLLEGGFASLEHPDHAWTHLARAISLLPRSLRSFAHEQLRTRVERWATEAQEARENLALRAQQALCELPDANENDWQGFAKIAHAAKALDFYEEALIGWTRVASRPEIPLLRLGIMLIQQERASAAIDALLRASHAPDIRDAAETWLGVALERSGEEQLASCYWQRVAESGTDSRMVEIARKLLRLPPLPA